MQSQARERIIVGRVAVVDAFNQVGEDLGMTPEELDAYVRLSGGDTLGSSDSRRVMVAANQGLGRDVSLAAECEVQNRLEDVGLDDEHVMDTVAARADAHPDMRAGLRLKTATEEEAEAAEKAGLKPIRERLAAYLLDDAERADPSLAPVSDDDLRAFITSAYGPEAVNEENVREVLESSRKRRAYSLADDVWEAERALRMARRDPSPDPEKISALEKAVEEAQKRRDSYDSKAEPGWPVNDQERKDLEQVLRIRTEIDADKARDKVVKEVNAERADIQRQALVEELSKVQTFGGQTIEPIATGGKVTKALRASFDEATALFPDAMVAQAKDYHPRLVLRQTSKRAHFASNKGQEWSEKTDMYVRLPYDLDIAPEEAFKDGMSYGYANSVPKGVEDTPENRAKVQAIADAHNEGRTAMQATSGTSWRSRKIRPLVVGEVTDEEGNTRLVLQTKNKVAQKVHGMASELTTSGSFSTTVHELGHMMESDPRVYFACKQFLRDRSEGKDSIVYNRSKRHGVEYAVPDGFANTYIGKDYLGTAHTEVFSMGMEGIFARRPGDGGCRGLVEMPVVTGDGLKSYDGVIDTEHRDLVLGILAGFQSSGVMSKTRAMEIRTRKENAEREEHRARKKSADPVAHED